MSQLAWPHVLPVALRLRVSEALLRTGHALDTYMTDERSKVVLQEFAKYSESAIEDAGNHYRTAEEAEAEAAAIDAYLVRVGQALHKQGGRLCAGSQLAKQLLDAIITACGVAVCPECKCKEICRWTAISGAADQERMASAGFCIQTVRHIFKWASGVVEQSYVAAGVNAPVKSSVLTTGYGTHNLDLELAIDAATRQGTRGAPRTIHMAFHPPKLWVHDYLALAYLFVHEFTAHAWCGVALDVVDAELSKRFHEGWMDAVAAAILRRSLSRPVPPTPALEFADQMWRQTRAVRGIRFNGSRPQPPADVWHWNSGARHFETLRWLFTLAQGENSTTNDDWEQASDASLATLIDLSLRLNASRITHRRRGDFAYKLESHYQRNTPLQRLEALSKRPQVIEWIKEYIVEKDERNFVGRVIELR